MAQQNPDKIKKTAPLKVRSLHHCLRVFDDRLRFFRDDWLFERDVVDAVFRGARTFGVDVV